MKKSIATLRAALLGLTLTGFMFMSSNVIAGGDSKPEGKPWPCPEKNMKMTNPLKSDANTLNTGKELWSQNCKSCHGKLGKGDGTKAESLPINCGDFSADLYQSKTDGELFYKTMEGRKPMPSFKQKLSESDAWSIILYTRSFSKKGEPVSVK